MAGSRPRKRNKAKYIDVASPPEKRQRCKKGSADKPKKQTKKCQTKTPNSQVQFLSRLF